MAFVGKCRDAAYICQFHNPTKQVTVTPVVSCGRYVATFRRRKFPPSSGYKSLKKTINSGKK
jgi:hypothetical protein